MNYRLGKALPVAQTGILLWASLLSIPCYADGEGTNPPPPLYPAAGRLAAPQRYEYTPPPAPPYLDHEVGIRGHVSGGVDWNGSTLWGFGGQLRYKPVPSFGLALPVDWISSAGFSELGVGFEAMLFRPRGDVRPYALWGPHWSSVHASQGAKAVSHYLGGQVGGGVEWRPQTWTHVAFHLEARVLVRARLGEVTQPGVSTGRVSANTGMSLYF